MGCSTLFGATDIMKYVLSYQDNGVLQTSNQPTDCGRLLAQEVIFLPHPGHSYPPDTLIGRHSLQMGGRTLCKYSSLSTEIGNFLFPIEAVTNGPVGPHRVRESQKIIYFHEMRDVFIFKREDMLASL